MKNRRKAVQPFEIKKRKIDIFRNYEANGFEKSQRKFENFSTLISKKSIMRPKTLQSYLNMGGTPLSRSAVSELQKRPDFPKAFRLSSTLVLYKVIDVYNWVISYREENAKRSNE